MVLPNWATSLLPQPLPIYSVQTLPPALDSSASNKDALPVIPVGGKLYAHRTARRICRQQRQSDRSSSLSYFSPGVPECPPFFLQVTSPTSRIDAFENNARRTPTADMLAGFCQTNSFLKALE